MKRINLLNEETSNKIAAGEVVERPASIVKELIENSIDAQSKNIIIEINEGGKKEIKITDDGRGIHPDDIEKAFMPHGTSKIINIEDLYAINTFGFRGEALPSIAAVSKVSLISRQGYNNFGKEIYISNSKIEYLKDIGCNIGTTVKVHDLFFNVPARQKFLKSDQRESSLISNMVNRLALANHNISFKYYNNDKSSLTTFASTDVKDTIRAVYGKNIYENLIGFEKHFDIISVHGYIGNTEISRGSRNNQSIFVNKRYIKSGLITTAVENAFKSFATVNKYPFFVIFLDIYPEFVDVNVHPTKSEVKFEDERMIYKIVFDTVHSAIAESIRKSFAIDDSSYFDDIDKKEVLSNKEVLNKNEEEPILVQMPIDLKENSGFIKSSIETLESSSKKDYLNTVSSDYINLGNNMEYKLEKTSIIQNTDNIMLKDSSNNTIPINSSEKDRIAKFPPLQIIGQFNKTYILAQAMETLYMIDQHAAHEKILFEKFKEQIKSRDVISQILMTPVVVELSHQDYTYYIENTDVFKETGFSIEIFGDNTISIREAPMILGKVNVKEFFLEMLDNIKNMGSGKTVEVKYDMIASHACKAAIKANHSLSQSEIVSLVEELRYIEEPFNCPHGRPTIIRMPLKDIEKKFKRIQ